jgi:hypothetical protein
MAIPLQIKDIFPDIFAAKNAIHGFIASNAKSFKTACSDRSRVILLFKLDGCLFKILRPRIICYRWSHVVASFLGHTVVVVVGPPTYPQPTSEP